MRRRPTAEASIDYAAVHQALPGMVALLTPDPVYADVNEAFVRGTGCSREAVAGRCAHVVDGAESTTAVTTFVGFDRHPITYSSAGHPPPVLLHREGRVEFPDRATGPPLDAQPDPAPRPEAATGFAPGATLVLYTDGLIERRREDIDMGLLRLAEALRRHRTQDPETLADIVLLELLPPGGATDDTALVVVRL